MELERWEEASAAFTRAASIRWWAYNVAVLKSEAERMMVVTKEGRESSTRRKGKGVLTYP